MTKIVYTRDEILLIKEKMIENVIPEELKTKDLTPINIGFPEPNSWRGKSRRNNRKNSHLPPLPDFRKPVKPLVKSENAWKPENISLKGLIPFEDKILEIVYKYFRKQPADIKEVQSLLNKITLKNEKEVVERIKFLNYTSPEIVKLIFKKAVSEPFFSGIYARMCQKLNKLRLLIQDMCTEQFKVNKNKNLCNFIGELYRKKIIISIHGILDDLMSTENLETNIDILCELITVVGPKRGVFDKSFEFLSKNKETLSRRFQFKVMDVEDYRSGKREVPVRKAKIK